MDGRQRAAAERRPLFHIGSDDSSSSGDSSDEDWSRPRPEPVRLIQHKPNAMQINDFCFGDESIQMRQPCRWPM
jgi:hypothetical protein